MEDEKINLLAVGAASSFYTSRTGSIMGWGLRGLISRLRWRQFVVTWRRAGRRRLLLHRASWPGLEATFTLVTGKDPQLNLGTKARAGLRYFEYNGVNVAVHSGYGQSSSIILSELAYY